MKIGVPELCLVVLVGPSGSGKSTFARKHFLPTEFVSSDFCRALVSDNENDQSATGDAFDLLHAIVRKRTLDFIAEGKRGVTQPEIKCRGAEYLRIIYGPSTRESRPAALACQPRVRAGHRSSGTIHSQGTIETHTRMRV